MRRPSRLLVVVLGWRAEGVDRMEKVLASYG